ncbi:MAG: C1 family peptidase, partial [Bacteroidota bacterium]
MKKRTSAFYALCCVFTLLSIISCDPEDGLIPIPDPNDPTPGNTSFALGWSGEEDLGTVPASTNFGFGNSNLPSSVNLIPQFPPIGDQGQLGTCVTWAVGYNIKTALSGMTRGLSTSQLANRANQYSPKDLFLAIPDQQKGPNCNGTNFSQALNTLQDRGVASFQTVPYSALGNCSQANLQSNWNAEASQNKIKYWRKIEPSVQSIKQNLANNVPVILGARLSDNFMSWNSSAVISSSTSFVNVGQHAYHALVIAGYDDNKGPNGAFRIINSWGEFWGDRGYIWIDYNYLITEFCNSSIGEKPLFIAADEEGSVTPPDTPDPVVSGVDLATWVFEDRSTYSFNATERRIDFNIYNIGNQSASPNRNWSFYYIYFNAYNADDYGVLFYDEFNNSANPNSYYCPLAYSCVFNYNIPPGGSFAQSVWGQSDQYRIYNMPPITGDYYLVLVADAGDQFSEQDELNNLFYTTLDPKYFQAGFAPAPQGEGGTGGTD